MGTDDQQRRGPGVGHHAGVGAHGHRGNLVDDRPTTARVHAVRIADAAEFNDMPVIAGGGERAIVERNLAGDVAATAQGLLDPDLPQLA